MEQTIQDKMQEMYVLDHTFNEQLVQAEQKDFYQNVVGMYGTWQKGLRAYSINRKKLKEREKFHLYWILKQRYEKYGEMALRPKNIDPVIKDRIVDVYKTMKNLNRIIKTWEEDKVLYETRALLLSGEQLDKIKQTQPSIYKQIIKFYEDIEGFQEEYENRFGIQKQTIDVAQTEEPVEESPVATTVQKEETNEPTPVVEQVAEPTHETPVKSANELEELLIKCGVLTKEQIQTLYTIGSISKDDVVVFIMEKILEAKKEGKTLSEETIQAADPTMYLAVNFHYGTLKQVLKEIRETFFV